MENINIQDQTSQPLAAENLDQQLSEARDRYLRLAADFDNYRKRTAREVERRAASQKDSLVRDLLPIIDNLERTLAPHVGGDLRAGVEMILKQMVETLGRHGFKQRDDFGKPFDGRFHDALALGCNPDLPDHAVIEVWERGWMRGEEMFRPAKVLVNKLESEDSVSFSPGPSLATN